MTHLSPLTSCAGLVTAAPLETAFRQDGMPFAGLRQSGLGVGGIAHTIADMQVDKMMVIKSVRPVLEGVFNAA